MHEYDKRQYQLMADSIKAFDDGKLKFHSLISILEGLIDHLQEADREWKDDFLSEWFTLEVGYAVASSRGETRLSPESQKLAEEAIENLKTLLLEVQS